MNRRAFVTGLGVLAAPLRARAQTGRVYRIGIVHPGSPPDAWVEMFELGLRDLGYRAGQNAEFEERWGRGHPETLADMSAELVRRNVDVLVTMTGPAVSAAKQQTSTIPIVMAISGDPLGLGLVPNLAHPGGNITGVSLLSDDLAAKRLEVLKEAVPRISRVAVLYTPAG